MGRTKANDPGNEAGRLEALRRYDILDTPPDGAFDWIASPAAELFHVPIALVSLVDRDRIWLKARHGLDATQIGRDPGLCASAIFSPEVYHVRDATQDPRTLANPLVAGEFGLRFFAAAPLCTHDGLNLGTFCVINRTPRGSRREEARAEVGSQKSADSSDESHLAPAAPGGDGGASLEDVERRHIASVLTQTNWMIEGERGAAKILNLNPSTLRSRMKNLGIERPD